MTTIPTECSGAGVDTDRTPVKHGNDGDLSRLADQRDTGSQASDVLAAPAPASTAFDRLVTSDDSAATRPEHTTQKAPSGAVAALSQLARCDQLASPGSPTGRRAHDLYCHWLPRGHSGACDPFPLPHRLAQEWTVAYYAAIEADYPARWIHGAELPPPLPDRDAGDRCDESACDTDSDRPLHQLTCVPIEVGDCLADLTGDGCELVCGPLDPLEDFDGGLGVPGRPDERGDAEPDQSASQERRDLLPSRHRSRIVRAIFGPHADIVAGVR